MNQNLLANPLFYLSIFFILIGIVCIKSSWARDLTIWSNRLSAVKTDMNALEKHTLPLVRIGGILMLLVGLAYLGATLFYGY